jgi:Histidine kinase-, DNA gyrase B-, and HSP90-like ATPase
MLLTRMSDFDQSAELFAPTFGANFLNQYVGSIIQDSKFAIIELVANSWDAGASEVQITWPQQYGEELRIADNGIGMTKAEFFQRWGELSYNRLENQGESVIFPKGITSRKRKAFGRNGVGRHAMFCFSREYWVETAKDGRKIKVKVFRSGGKTPFNAILETEQDCDWTGTRIFTNIERLDLRTRDVIDHIGSKFVSDPDFLIYVNSQKVTLEDLEGSSSESKVQTSFGEVLVRRFDSGTGRTSNQSGVAWWVDRRLVGMPSWEILEESILDARLNAAKRLVYVVEVNNFDFKVKPDWSGFYRGVEIDIFQREILDFIKKDLHFFRSEINRERKRGALEANRELIRPLPLVTQEQIVSFIEQIQIQSPTMSEKDLNNTVKVYSNLEKSRTGYSLIERLAKLSSEELDDLDQILSEWSVDDAKKILGELRYRLSLIEKLESLVESHQADELHDLQPLFARGLWIFGPEFESISYTSNRSLTTVLKELLEPAKVQNPRLRPDFVILPDSSIGIYSRDGFDVYHEISGIGAVVIVELKRGGFKVTNDEKDQAQRYSRSIRKSGKVGNEVPIICYVLGTEIDFEARETLKEGETTIFTQTYGTVLKKAHARTFNLLDKLEKSTLLASDDDLEEIVRRPNLFEN